MGRWGFRGLVQRQGKAISPDSSINPAARTRTAAGDHRPCSLYTQLQRFWWLPKARRVPLAAPGATPSQEGTTGTAALVAPGRARSAAYPGPMSWGVPLAPCQAVTPRHLLSRHPDPGMCPLKDRVSPPALPHCHMCSQCPSWHGMGWHAPSHAKGSAGFPRGPPHPVLQSRPGPDQIPPSQGRKPLPNLPPLSPVSLRRAR